MSGIRESKEAVLFVCSLALFTDMLVYGIIIPILPEILHEAGVPDQDVNKCATILFAVYAVGLLVATPIFGFYSDKYRNRQVPMLIGLLGLGVTTLVFASSNSYPLLILARLLQGVSAAASWVVGFAMVADVYPADRMGFASGIIASSHSLGFVGAPVIGGALASMYGVKAPFYVCAGFALVDFAARLAIKPPGPEQTEGDRDPEAEKSTGSGLWHRLVHSELVRLLQHGEIAIHAAAVMMSSCSFSIVEALIADYLERKFSQDIMAKSITLMWFLLPAVISSVTVGYIADRVSRTRMILVGLILHCPAPPMLALATSATLLRLAGVYFSFTFSILNSPVLPFMTQVAKRQGHASSLATLYAIYNLSYSMGMVVGPVAAGYLVAEFSFFAGCLFVPVTYAAFIPFYLYFMLKMERKRAGLDSGRSSVLVHASSDLFSPRRPISDGQ